MNHFHRLQEFNAISPKQEKKGASLAHFFPPPDKHNPSQPFTQISSFQKIFTSQSSLVLILYLADKPHFIPTQQQSDKNCVCVETQAVQIINPNTPPPPIYRVLCVATVRHDKHTLDPRTSGHFHRGDDRTNTVGAGNDTGLVYGSQ